MSENNEQRFLFEIPEQNFDRFRAAINKISKKAVKLGMSEFEPVVFGYHYKNIDNDRAYKVFEVYINVDIPKIDGWRFVASVIYPAYEYNIIKEIPNSGINIPARYRNANHYCEHCNTSRYRKKTFILVNENNEFKQVGSSCIKDFIGHDPYKVSAYFECISQIQNSYNENTEYNSDEFLFNTKKLLACVSYSIRNYQWVSNKQSKESYDDDTHVLSTKDHAVIMLNKKNVSIDLSEDDYSIAEKTIDFIKNMKIDTTFDHNIHNSVINEYISFQMIGFASYAVKMYLDSIKPKKEKSISEYIYGTDNKISCDVIIKIKKAIQNNFYDNYYLYVFVDSNDNELVWFTGKNIDSHIGDIIKIKATIKDHREYNGIKQTILTRCKIDN